ncbi:MAG: hypothetical protein HQ477_00210 [Chloroflexi bacterium]|nr:hypothetical protein [Chloroflexota bacterium]
MERWASLERWVKGHEGVFGRLGSWAFIAGYVLAIIAGLFWPDSGELILVLVLLGLVVGILNITQTEMLPYLVAAIALVLIGSTGVFTPLNLVTDGLGEDINLIVRMMSIFTAPAALVTAIRAGVHFAGHGEGSAAASDK